MYCALFSATGGRIKCSVRASWLLAVCCSTPVVVIISLQLLSTFAPRNLPPWENKKNNRNYAPQNLTIAIWTILLCLTLWFTHNPYLLWGYKDLPLCCLTWQKMSKQKYLKNIFSLCLRQGKAAGYCGHMAFVRRLSGEINFNFGGKSFR